MKNTGTFMKDFFYAFGVTLILIGFVVGSLWGMAVAEENTVAIGFYDYGGKEQAESNP
jgi:hypothetical protein